jgi:hypothetical protein
VPTISLAKRTRNILQVPTPIRNEYTSLDITMETAVRPVRDAGDMSMLDRVEMNVVDVSLKIGFVADRMLPVASLPNALLSLETLLSDLDCGSRPREKPLLIKLQRVEKSISPSGKVHIAWT